MSNSIITVSSKGQIALPVSVRKALGISTGDKLLIYVSGEVIMLKKLNLSPLEEFELRQQEAQKWAASVGYNEEDVEAIVKSSRAKYKK